MNPLTIDRHAELRARIAAELSAATPPEIAGEVAEGAVAKLLEKASARKASESSDSERRLN